jgi:hypothetical protein
MPQVGFKLNIPELEDRAATAMASLNFLYAHITFREIKISILNSAKFYVKQNIYPSMFRGPLVSMTTATNYNHQTISTS